MMRIGNPIDTAGKRDVQCVRLTVTTKGHTRVKASLTLTSPGLLAIGAMVSSILLASAVIVRAARR